MAVRYLLTRGAIIFEEIRNPENCSNLYNLKTYFFVYDVDSVETQSHGDTLITYRPTVFCVVSLILNLKILLRIYI